MVTELKRDYDYILIDCPAGIEQGFKNAIAGADRAIVVTTPEISAVRDADRIIGLLEQEDIEPPKLIINRIKRHLMYQEMHLTSMTLQRICRLTCLALCWTMKMLSPLRIKENLSSWIHQTRQLSAIATSPAEFSANLFRLCHLTQVNLDFSANLNRYLQNNPKPLMHFLCRGFLCDFGG